jgi:hypothetical protein
MVVPKRHADKVIRTGNVVISRRTGQARRRLDKLQQIAKLLTRINEVKDTATLNSLRNEVIKILMCL